jgi:CheY-like chemotaxis protein
MPEREAESVRRAGFVDGGHGNGLVLDEIVVRRLVRQTLEQLGSTVLQATDGHRALWVIEQYKSEIHLLLTDGIMPLMNGHELARRLKSICPRTKVPYMSGYNGRGVGLPRHCPTGDRLHSGAAYPFRPGREVEMAVSIDGGNGQGA